MAGNQQRVEVKTKLLQDANLQKKMRKAINLKENREKDWREKMEGVNVVIILQSQKEKKERVNFRDKRQNQ